MFEKKKRLSFFLLISLFIAGCNTELQTKLYGSDLLATTKQFQTSASMKLEVPSCTSDKLPTLISGLEAIFSKSSEATVQGCKREGFDSYITVDFKATLGSSGVHNDITSDVVLFRSDIGSKKEGDLTLLRFAITPKLNPDFKRRADEFMKSNRVRLSSKNMRLELVVVNDTEHSLFIDGYSVWMDGTPREWYNDVLKRREEMSIVYSNVATQLILLGQDTYSIYIGAPM